MQKIVVKQGERSGFTPDLALIGLAAVVILLAGFITSVVRAVEKGSFVAGEEGQTIYVYFQAQPDEVNQWLLTANWLLSDDPTTWETVPADCRIRPVQDHPGYWIGACDHRPRILRWKQVYVGLEYHDSGPMCVREYDHGHLIGDPCPGMYPKETPSW
jgi:hypothetical protein